MTTLVLTRPEGENERLHQMLEEQGYDVLVRPLIKLLPLAEDEETRQRAMNIDQQDFLIFVSKSAVRYGVALLDEYWPQWPIVPTWLAVGEGTAEAMGTHGVRAVYPEMSGSEGLLELPELADLQGKNVTIVRGEGGRELLFEELTRRGATVSYLEVYRREPLTYKDWPAGSDCLIAVTSLEALENLQRQLADVSTYRVVVVSGRIASSTGGFSSSTIAAGASDQALYDAIVESL